MEENNSKSKTKVFVIGLDGATWTVLRPMMEEGHMPTLKKLVEEGVSGDLTSTIPSHSGPAWTSFITGKNPGKHGIFGFLKPMDKKGKTGVISSGDIKSKMIFHILNEASKEVGFVNLPVIYPPLKVNGFMVSSELLLPTLDSDFTYPNDLFEKIGWRKEDYFMDRKPLRFNEGRAVDFIQQLIGRLEKRRKLTLELIEKFECDFMGVVFRETDPLQHYLWHIFDPTHSRFSQETHDKIKPLIINFFKKIDDILVELINKTGKNTQIIIMSDHGFGPYEKHLGINMILEESRLLCIKKRIKKGKLWHIQHKMRGFLSQNSDIYKFLKNFIKKLIKKGSSEKIKFLKERDVLSLNYIAKLVSSIDWLKTKAYYLSDSGSGIFVNLKGRESHGIVNPGKDYEDVRDQVISIVNNLKSPGNGRYLGLKAYRKEEIYSGEYLYKAPDIVIDNQTDYQLSFNFRDKVFQDTESYTGFHRRNGIVIMYGDCFKRKMHIDDAQILDIAPTVLYLLGVAVPKDIDGKVLEKAIEEGFLTRNPVSYQKTTEIKKEITQKEDIYSQEDLAKVEQRLADLGYLG